MLNQQSAALDVVCGVLGGRNLTDTLAATLQRYPHLEAGDRAAVQDLSYGTLRHLGLLRGVLRQLVRQKPDPDIEVLLLIALYQLQFSRSAPWAVVDHAVQLAGELTQGKAGGFVNACLRRFQREQETLLAQARSSSEGRWSHPQWWIERLQRDWPAEWQTLLETANGRAPMTLRVNCRRGNRADYLPRLAAAGIEARPLGEWAIRLEAPVPVSTLPGFAEGDISVQDHGAQLAALLLDAAPGQRVLDACAAPGGKTAHILERADVDMFALDHDGRRLQRVEDNLRRLQLHATLREGDASRPNDWWDGRPFDRILADVPCSASGVTRRHPDIKWLRRPRDIKTFAAQQRAIVSALWPCLARGGRLLYATCSIFPEENRAQEAALLSLLPGSRSVPLALELLNDGQLLPTADHDGFYYLLLEKS